MERSTRDRRNRVRRACVALVLSAAVAAAGFTALDLGWNSAAQPTSHAVADLGWNHAAAPSDQ
jgi:hypothetical protein